MVRPHGALNGETPFERLMAKTRADVLPEGLRPYKGMLEVSSASYGTEALPSHSNTRAPQFVTDLDLQLTIRDRKDDLHPSG